MTNQELTSLAREYLDSASKNMEKIDEGTINHCLINLREKCLNLLVFEVSPKKEMDLDLETRHQNFKHTLSTNLPKINLPKLIYKNEFSLSSLLALSLVLFLIGCSLGEALIWVLGISNNFLAYFLGIVSAFIFLLGQKSEKFSRKIDDFYDKDNLALKTKFSPKKMIKRIFWRKIVILVLIIGFVVWDFFSGLPNFYVFRQGILIFLEQGKILLMLFNPYGISLIILTVMLISKRKKHLDKEQMEVQISTALINWWPNALNYAKSIYQNQNSAFLDKDLAKNLIAVANVLPSSQQAWYSQILKKLGLEVYNKELNSLALPENCATVPFIWHEDFLNYFDKYDYIKEGDQCFVDTNPIGNDEQLLRKGLVRKVR